MESMADCSRLQSLDDLTEHKMLVSAESRLVITMDFKWHNQQLKKPHNVSTEKIKGVK
jgi:hypothetical protein